MKRLRELMINARAELAALLAWWTHELRETGELFLSRIAPRLVTRALIHVDNAGEPTGLQAVARNARTVIVFAPAQILRHEIVLPDSVERDLDQVIALHLERELPLARDRVCVDYQVIRRSREDRRITVRVLIARKDDVERLRELAQSAGVKLLRIAVKAEPGDLVGNFLRGPSQSAQLRLTLANRRLAALAAVLAIAVLGTAAGQWVYERTQVDEEASRVSEIAATVDALAKQLMREAAPAQTLTTLMSAPDSTDVLLSLTAGIPPDSWVYELEVTAPPTQRAQIKLSGFAPVATSLVDALEKLPQFEQVRLDSAISAGLGTSQDRLQVAARWVGDGATAAVNAPSNPPQGRVGTSP